MVAPGAKGSFPSSTDDATKPKNIIALSNPHTRTTGFQGTRIYMVPPGTKGGSRLPLLYFGPPPDISWTSCHLRTGLSPSPCAGGNAPKPHPVAGFGCKLFKYLLGAHETLQNCPGSKLITTRRFTQMAARHSWSHRTLGRGLEQCFPTSKYATCTQSLPWAKSCTSQRPPKDCTSPNPRSADRSLRSKNS